jgi:hypothetical protein
MAKIISIKNITEISGFGKYTGYEKACQDMLQAGFVFLETHKDKRKLTATAYQNVYGIFDPKSEKAKELSKAVVKAHPDCTGAMHQAVMGHLFYIAHNGVDKWKEEIKKK